MNHFNPWSRQMSLIQLWSACLGNFFEHFETALFGFLSPFLAPLIFPDQEPLIALILTYAMIPLGMLARPLGALVFGYVGDVYSRSQALFLTLAGMSLVSGCIALSPTYEQAGVLAPIIFCLGRLMQNFFASGETMGGAIFLLENTSKNKHDLLSSLYNASTIGGILFASAGVSALYYYQVIDWGWRLLYMLGCLTAFFGCLIRWQAPSSSRKASSSFTGSILNQARLLWQYRQAFLSIAITSGFAYANYSIAIVFMNGFVPLISAFTKADMISLNTVLLVLDFAALPVFGWLAAKTSREKLMLSATIGVILGSIPLLMLLKSATLLSIFVVRISFILFGVAFFAPFHAWAQELVPAHARYAIVSLGYAIGSQLLGGPAAALSLWIFKQTGSISSASWYLILLAVGSSCILAKTIHKKVDLLKETG